MEINKREKAKASSPLHNGLPQSELKLKIEKIIVIHVPGGQMCLMRSSWGPYLSFQTLRSKFDCITTKNISLILVILGQNREKILLSFQSTEIYRKLQ